MASMPDQLQRLRAAPQSIWLDFISRPLIETGTLDRMIEVGKANGYLTDLPTPVDFDTAMGLPRGEVLVLATGGDWATTLSGMARVAPVRGRRAPRTACAALRRRGGARLRRRRLALRLPPPRRA